VVDEGNVLNCVKISLFVAVAAFEAGFLQAVVPRVAVPQDQVVELATKIFKLIFLSLLLGLSPFPHFPLHLRKLLFVRDRFGLSEQILLIDFPMFRLVVCAFLLALLELALQVLLPQRDFLADPAQRLILGPQRVHFPPPLLRNCIHEHWLRTDCSQQLHLSPQMPHLLLPLLQSRHQLADLLLVHLLALRFVFEPVSEDRSEPRPHRPRILLRESYRLALFLTAFLRLFAKRQVLLFLVGKHSLALLWLSGRSHHCALALGNSQQCLLLLFLCRRSAHRLALGQLALGKPKRRQLFFGEHRCQLLACVRVVLLRQVGEAGVGVGREAVHVFAFLDDAVELANALLFRLQALAELVVTALQALEVKTQLSELALDGVQLQLQLSALYFLPGDATFEQ